MNNRKVITIDPRVRDALKRLGFTDNFINIYAILLVKRELNARDLSEYSGVTYTRIYVILNDMIKLDLIIKINGFPCIFLAIAPDKMFKFVKKRRNEEYELSLSQTCNIFERII